jgi:hypothetical protein
MATTNDLFTGIGLFIAFSSLVYTWRTNQPKGPKIVFSSTFDRIGVSGNSCDLFGGIINIGDTPTILKSDKYHENDFYLTYKDYEGGVRTRRTIFLEPGSGIYLIIKKAPYMKSNVVGKLSPKLKYTDNKGNWCDIDKEIKYSLS